MKSATRPRNSKELAKSIGNYVKRFGLNIDSTVGRLSEVARDFRVRKNLHDSAQTRGDVLRQLRDLLGIFDAVETPREAIPALLARLNIGADILTSDTIHALCLHDIVPRIAYQPIDEDEESLSPPPKEAIEVAAFKSMIARMAAEGKPTLLKATNLHKGLEEIPDTDTKMALETLQWLAVDDPVAFRFRVSTVAASLMDTFQVADKAGGRNTSTQEGIIAKPEWQLINDVLDIIWPIERGPLHSSKMSSAISIIDATKFLATGLKLGRNDKKREGRANDDMIKRALTLRHQLGALIEANQAIDCRQRWLFKEFKKGTSHLPADVYSRRSNRLYSLAIYPLADWQAELSRRLRFGDYRPWDDTIRRPTGQILSTPPMPPLTKDMSLSRRLIRLIHAAKSHRSRA